VVKKTVSRISFCSSSYRQNVKTFQQTRVFTTVLEVRQHDEMEQGHELSFLSFNVLSVTGDLQSAAPSMCSDQFPEDPCIHFCNGYFEV
jgi:hypothetical protein